MAEAKFVINGRDYDIPGIDTFNLDEAMVLYHYSKLTLDQVADLEGVHPGVVAALLHVGIARAEPDARLKDIEKVVRAVSVMELIEKMEAATDDDAVDPPAAETAQPPIEPGYLAIDIPDPTETERLEIWRRELADHGADAGNLGPLTSRWRIGATDSLCRCCSKRACAALSSRMRSTSRNA